MQTPSSIPVSIQTLCSENEQGRDAECELQNTVLGTDSQGEDIGCEDEGGLEGYENRG